MQIQIKKERTKTILLGSSIIEQWPSDKYIPNSLNLGISGLTSGELMESYCRIPPHKNIILYIGSNDITKNDITKNDITKNDITNEIYQNITEFILTIIKNKNQHIFFVAILKSPNRTPTQIQKIDTINRKMREFSQKHPQNIHFCNLNRELSSPKNYLPDKIHLSETGYSILSNHILSFL
jgi:lysophospholipase L1-like esterase